ncbi:hypothetical protein [Massilia sp. PWRC2]|uniref:hypothetical protein n=1 Tax=Massilia sp. PWRC2 TaxID=2804626 RepID=UPI003CFB69A4
MNSDQRSEANNQSSNGGTPLPANPAGTGTVHSGSQQAGGQQSGQPGSDRHASTQGGTYQETGTQPSGAHQPGYQNAAVASEQRTTAAPADNLASRSAPAAEMTHLGNADDRQSDDLAGALPRSPAGSHQHATEKMNDDTGLSNTANRQAPAAPGDQQDQQSNVGRRSDGTPD